MNIAFVIASLGQGGAERVAVNLSGAWAALGHDVRLLIFDPPEARIGYTVPSSVTIENLDLMKPSAGILGAVMASARRIRTLRAAIRRAKPDIVVSFMLETNVLTLLACKGEPWPIVISERIHPAYHPVGRVWGILRRRIYASAAAVVAQTSAIAEWLSRNTGARAVVIPNPVDIEAFRLASSGERSSRKTLLAVGRLAQQKGHDVAIMAFSKVADVIPDWDFLIVGEGAERTALQKMIDSLGMSHRISLVGATADIGSFYRDADALVHSARYEGYPNVIAEALTAGKPVIALDSPGATRELMADGIYGVLVPQGDLDGLAAALRQILSDPQKLIEMARNAPAATANNGISAIAAIWLDLFTNIRSAKE